MDTEEKGQKLTGGLGFRRVAHWSLTVATMQLLPVTAVWTTRCSRRRESRWCCPLPRFCPDGEWIVDWGQSPASGTPGECAVVALGLPKPKKPMSKSARKRERGQDQREEEGYRRFVGIDGLPWRLRRPPAGDSVRLTVFPRGEKSERGEEE
jgi:hypothetical protein